MNNINRIQLLVIIPLLVFLLPWFIHGLAWPEIISTQLGHCPKQNCDFLNHYLPQSIRIYEGDLELQEGWFYPPTLAILLEAILIFPPDLISPLWTSFNLCLMLLLILLGTKILMRALDSTFHISFLLWSSALVCTSMPVLSSVKWGQISLCIVLLCWWGLWDRTKDLYAGLAIGLAGACKAFPILYLLYPLMKKRVGLVGYSILFMIVLGGMLPLIRIGWTQTLVHYVNMLAAGQVIQEVAPRWGGQALAPTMYRWFVNGDHMMDLSSPLLFTIPEAVYPAFFGLCILSLSIYTFHQLRTHSQPLVLLFCWFGLLMSPGWQHYFCFLPLCALSLWPALKWKGRAVLVVAMCIERIPILLLAVVPHIYYDASAYGTTTIATLLVLFSAFGISETK